MTKKLNKTQLQDLVNILAWNDGFGCYTRAGFEKMIWPEIADRAKWIIYFDIDNMHELNKAHGGYDPVDAMIKEVLALVRATDYVAGQWKSGDEFLVCITNAKGGSREISDPHRMVNRLTAQLKEHGLSATFAVVPVISKTLSINVAPAVEKVYAAKKLNKKGR